MKGKTGKYDCTEGGKMNKKFMHYNSAKRHNDKWEKD